MTSRSPLIALLAAAVAACGGDPPRAAAPDAPAPSTPAEAQAPAQAQAPPAFRLPAGATPVRYHVTLTVIPGEATMAGEVEIDLVLRAQTSLLWLNAADLAIREATLESGGARQPARVIPGGSSFVGFAFGAPAPAGPARLRASYTAKISDKDDRGVFSEELDGARYVFTQFQNVEARKAFPCFDEPAYKVPWQLTLRVRDGDAALSNTPALEEAPAGGGMKLVRFAETKPLPSYLVAFAVGRFDLVDAGKAGKNRTPVRIAVPKGRRAEARYAVEVTGSLIEAIEDLLGIPYPYEKLDLVAIPHLASFGAMENAGLITSKKSLLLARPEEETPGFQRDYASVMVHEIAHQWFGDLVTMAWWDEVWLNESFATWMEGAILERWKPAWSWELEKVHARSWAMSQDSLITVRKIRQEVTSEDDIQSAFDAITYEKGSSVLSMFESYLGPEVFRKGVRGYLEKHAHKNATAADLLAAISAAQGHDIAPAFSTFLDQPGVPRVKVALECGQGKQSKLTLSQDRYLPAGSPGGPDQRWRIPVCVRYEAGGKEARACTLLAERAAELPLPGSTACPRWISPNADAKGYYRVGYTPEALRALAGRLDALTLPERVALASDARALLSSGELPAGEALALVPGLMKDPAPQVQEAALGLSNLPETLVPEALRPGYTRFVNRAFGARARSLGLRPKPGEAEAVRLLRPPLVGFVALRGDDRALANEASALAKRWLDDPRAVEEEVVDLVLGIAAAHGDRALFDRLRAELARSSDDGRRRHLIDALASFRDPALVRDSLALALSEDLDPRLSIRLFFQDPRMLGVTYDFVKDRFDAILARLPGELRGFTPRVGSGFCDEARRADVDAFFKPRIAELTGGRRSLGQTLESISLCAALRKAQEAHLAAFLKRY
jgi:alanyl aminopeptidase